MRSERTRRASGFTLVELLVALLLTSLVVLLAHALLADVSGAARRVQEVARQADRDGSRRLWLVRTFAGVDVAGSAPLGFRGVSGVREGREADQVAFRSWVRVGERHELRVVRIGLTAAGRVLAEVRLPPGPRDATPDLLVLGEGIAALGLDYLLDYGAAAPWVAEWVSPVSAPVAVRWRMTRADGRADTLLFHVGPRG
jgi:prepilin-type N-terminal cleavage/methylation domain-containing protein